MNSARPSDERSVSAYTHNQQMKYYGRAIRLLMPISGRHGRVIGWDYRAEDGRTLYAPLRRLGLYGEQVTS